MEAARLLLEGYGYWLLLAVGFAEFAGLPIASVPVLIVAGAAAAEGAISLPAAALAAAVGGLLADATWYSLSRWRGQRLVDTVCNLSSNPRSCVLSIANQLEKVGPMYVLPSKFVPGTGNLVAASAGLAGLRPFAFLSADAVALGLWSVVYLGLGYLLEGQVAATMNWVAGFAGVAAAAAAALILGAIVWRFVRAGMHREGHRRAMEPVDISGSLMALDADVA
jgi:membrane protein DedA with SNARE-associated domain